MKRPLTEIETQRAEELLLQRATEGLDEHQTAELAALGADDDASFDIAAASAMLATLSYEEMPAHLAAKLATTTGMDTTAGPSKASVLPPVIPIGSGRKSRATMYAAIAAAASLVIAAGAIFYAAQVTPKETIVERVVEVPAPLPKLPTPAEARAELLATAKDATTLPWTATKDPNAAGASGDVVWSASQQRGFMRFAGLAQNDQKAIQYQLWIFDKDRDQAFPVDGGVFDVSSTGEVIVPITAKLVVNEPVLFAVTIEKPGGVVVSKRERIVVTAAPKG